MIFRNKIALILAFALVLSLTGCQTTPAPTDPPETITQPTTEPTTEPATEATTEPVPETTDPPDPAQIYNGAAGKLNQVTDLTLNITMDRTLDIDGTVYSDSTQQILAYSGYGTDSLSASLTETTTSGNYTTTYSESFADGTLFVCVDSSNYFKGAMTHEDFLSRFAPAVLLNTDLYGSITQQGSTITFSDPTAGESWLVPEYGKLVDASGTAELDENEDLIGAAYHVTYAIGGARITWDIQVKIEQDSARIYPVADVEYIELEFIDAPRMVHQAAGYLNQATVGHSVTTSTVESIISYAAGIIQNKSVTINSWGSDDDYMADVDVSLYMMQGSEEYSLNRVEHFQDGIYTYCVDGSDPETLSGITGSAFQTYCATTLVGNLIEPQNWVSATAEDLGSLYYIEMTGTDELGESLNRYICATLWADENYLNNLASKFETTTMDIYLAIDKFTGLPTAAGFYFEGKHTINFVGYTLSLQTNQAFDLASTDAYESLTEELPTVEEPETKATPLFYHVTGPEGQEMWLLGTIHIGDERTSYLPQEIYDAFDAADALAVEYNSEAFEEELENNEELSDQISDCYFYSDGSTTGDHINDKDLFEFAEKLMKATGNYHMNVPYLKAYIWSSSIDNFYLRQSYGLNSTQGVDNQLIHRAMEQDKTILDVESGLFQTQMITGFSDGLQELLLLESAATDPLEYIESSWELFEMWCAGDEAAMIAYLNDDSDTSELTEEELAMLEEYNNAMGTDRNDDMLDVAVGYLESGDVVFYAVGLAHLLAEDGLVNTLRDAGYTVELVPYE